RAGFNLDFRRELGMAALSLRPMDAAAVARMDLGAWGAAGLQTWGRLLAARREPGGLGPACAGRIMAGRGNAIAVFKSIEHFRALFSIGRPARDRSGGIHCAEGSACSGRVF